MTLICEETRKLRAASTHSRFSLYSVHTPSVRGIDRQSPAMAGVATVNSAANRMGVISCRHLFGWGLSPLRHPTAENFRKEGVHEVGTVVFTVSAQFGVPVIHMWGLTRDITNCL